MSERQSAESVATDYADELLFWRELADELGQLLERYGWLIYSHDDVRRPEDVAAILAKWRAVP